ncbi:transglycosylase family protein [Patulibacter americanus]|uniref:transglycosylase family protein n=1 Tax=Patulibacter americanus TaxID=588672 RepID=UPI0003B4A000|nr:transglycosylase family protein [Patulibacter americanus]
MTVPLALRGRTGVLAGGLLLALLALVLLPHLAPAAPSSSALRGEIDRQSRREAQLQGTAAKLGALEASATKAAAVGQRRLSEVQVQYDRAQAQLATTSADLRSTRARLVRLHRRLDEGREVLARVLRTRYVADPPDVVDVVLSSDGFSDLLERVDFLKRVQAQDTRIVTAVRRARSTAAKDEARLATLRRGQHRQTEAAARQRDAMASMAAGLERRRAAVAEAHDARVAALSAARSKRATAQRTLAKLQREQERAARQFVAPAPGRATTRAAAPAPKGEWAIPWPIVQCESGGQNVGPNSMGASGYYQFMEATWKGLGGSTKHAYQASKAEQDRLAAKLWAGGAGAGNWDCAAMVGITG